MGLLIKVIMIILGFWLPAVLLDAIRAETAEKARARGKSSVLAAACLWFCWFS